MSTPALALPLSRGLRRQRRRHALSRVPLQWHEVPVAASGVLETPPRRNLPRWLVVALAIAVVALHPAAWGGGGVWDGGGGAPGGGSRFGKSTPAAGRSKPPRGEARGGVRAAPEARGRGPASAVTAAQAAT